jgi:hypothetical protein
MRSLNILATNSELQCLFPEAKLKSSDIEFIGVNHKLTINNNGEDIYINHYVERVYDILSELKSFNDFLSIDFKYANPIDNLIIVVDRKLWSDLYLPLMKNYKDVFNQLEKIYVDRNVTVLFNFAFLEANEYEIDEQYFRYDFKFKHIKLTDYEMFEGENNFYYNSFYSMFHIFAEGQITKLLFPSSLNGNFQYNIDFHNMFDGFNVSHSIAKKYVYSNLALKPRFHRVQFLLKGYENRILSKGLNCINQKYLEEYTQATQEGHIYTDNTRSHTDNHKQYFTKEVFDKLNLIKNEITVTPLNAPFEYNHSLHYFNDREYDNSYFEVVGETHCIFGLKHGFFTEKSIKPVLSEKFELVFGSNKIYKEYAKIGVDLFLDDFGLNGIEDKNELEQIDIIINFLKNQNVTDARNLFIQKTPILKENKQKLIKHYCKIMNDINKLL